jgi:osmotically-inducible protein OsmY
MTQRNEDWRSRDLRDERGGYGGYDDTRDAPSNNRMTGSRFQRTEYRSDRDDSRGQERYRTTGGFDDERYPHQPSGNAYGDEGRQGGGSAYGGGYGGGEQRNDPWYQGGTRKGGRDDYSGGYGRTGQRSMSQGSGREYVDEPRYGGGYGSGSAGNADSGGYNSGATSQWGGREAGLHRGKGPKGYARSDERLKEMLSERLMEDPAIDASEVSIQVSGQTVTLDGTVDSRRTKYDIEQCAEDLGATDIVNNIKVRRASDSTGSASSDAASLSGKSGSEKTSTKRGY